MNFSETNIVVVYILAVLISSLFSSNYLYGIIASILGTLSFNYLFTEPFFTLEVNNPDYFVTFIVMTITAIISSTLTNHIQKNAIEAKKREQETKTLYELTSNLTVAKTMDDIITVSIKYISQCFSCQAAMIKCNLEGTIPPSFFQQLRNGNYMHREIENRKSLQTSINNLKESYLEGIEFCDWPIYGHQKLLSILRIPVETMHSINTEQLGLLKSMTESIALAMDRVVAGIEQMKVREEIIQERYRSNLLRAISHDLRTPLTSIMGSSEVLMDMLKNNEIQKNIVNNIYKDADWLHSLVENILSLTKLQNGKLTIQKKQEAVEEIIGEAVSHITSRYKNAKINVSIPNELMLVPMDGHLIEQVIFNLTDNAIKNSQNNIEVDIDAMYSDDNKYAVFNIKDRGKGIKEKDLNAIFQPFYTSRDKLPDSDFGIGLGLTICQAIIKAHCGNIIAKNRDGGGAIFSFTLPMEKING